MKYANGTEANVGDTVIAKDTAGNLVSGVVIGFNERGDGFLRLSSTPILVPPGRAYKVEDAYSALEGQSEGSKPAAPTQAPSPATPEADPTPPPAAPQT